MMMHNRSNNLAPSKEQDDNPDNNVDCLIRKMLASDHDNTKEDAIRAPNIQHPREETTLVTSNILERETTLGPILEMKTKKTTIHRYPLL